MLIKLLRDIGCIVGLFLIGTLILYALTRLAPTGFVKSDLQYPHDFSQMRAVATMMQDYSRDHWNYVLILFSAAYLYKQSFMIPGSVLLNILAGAIFGVKIALPLCCFLSGCGATCSYLISQRFGKSLVDQFFRRKMILLRAKVESNKSNLFSYLLFLRLFPMSPNWFINLVCPLIDVPLSTFFTTVVIGLLPYNYVCIQAGEMLSSIKSLQEIFTFTVFFQLLAMAVVSLAPNWYFKRQQAQ